VCSTLPLEQKLPDEFRDIWLASQKSAAAKSGAKDDAKAAKKDAPTGPSALLKGPLGVAAVGATLADPSAATPAAKKAEAVMTLSVDRKFASKAEERAAESERLAVRWSTHAHADAPTELLEHFFFFIVVKCAVYFFRLLSVRECTN
jgi:hypothetical protein